MAEAHQIKQSDEGDAKGLELARAQGEALTKTLKHMTDDIAEDGREEQVGEYLVAYAVEQAEGMYEMKNGKLEWGKPAEGQNAHVEIAVRDPADGRFIPGLDIEVTVTAEDGTDCGTHKVPLLWHPYLYHYGRDWTVPGSGKYSLRVRFDPPTFMRHDKKNGNRFSTAVDHVFHDVKIKAGAEDR